MWDRKDLDGFYAWDRAVGSNMPDSKNLSGDEWDASIHPFGTSRKSGTATYYVALA